MSKDFLSNFANLPDEIKNKILIYKPVEEEKREYFTTLKRHVKIRTIMKELKDQLIREEVFFIQWFMYYVFSWIEKSGGKRKKNLFLGENNTAEIRNYGMKRLCDLEERKFESCMKFTRDKMLYLYE